MILASMAVLQSCVDWATMLTAWIVTLLVAAGLVIGMGIAAYEQSRKITRDDVIGTVGAVVALVLIVTTAIGWHTTYVRFATPAATQPAESSK